MEHSLRESELFRRLNPQAVPIVDISDFFRSHGLKFRVHMALDYLNHENISGNKLRKLLYPLTTILNSEVKSVSSLGGYFSNHLSALAWAGNELGLKTTAYINGEKPKYQGYSLRFLEAMKMDLIYLSRSEFKNIREENHELITNNTDSFFIPMGGKSAQAIFGFRDFVYNINQRAPGPYDQWWISYGTGTSTLAIANYLENDQHIYAQGAVSDEEVFSEAALEELGLASKILDKVSYLHDNYFKGIGKTSAVLIELIKGFHTLTGIPLDPIYTGKLVYAFLKYLEEGKGNSKSHYLLIHSGGIQGIHGFNEINKTDLPFKTDFDKIKYRTVFSI